MTDQLIEHGNKYEVHPCGNFRHIFEFNRRHGDYDYLGAVVRTKEGLFVAVGVDGAYLQRKGRLSYYQAAKDQWGSEVAAVVAQ